MKKSGFTLIELLGVIVVLSIMIIVSAPSIIGTFRNASEKEYTAFLTRLYNATETYVELNRKSYDQLNVTGGFVDIPIDILMKEGLIKKLGIDPNTGNPVPRTYSVTATRQADGTVSYAIYNQNTSTDSYYQTGLLLHLDAINNVGDSRGFHDSKTTSWGELADSKSGKLNNFSFNASSGWTNNSLIFDGTNDFVSGLPNTAIIHPTTNYTWTAYIKVDATSPGSAIIFGNRYSADGSTTPMQFTKLTRNAFEYYPGAAYGVPYVLATGTWVHVAIVKNQTTIYYYVNGTLVNSVTSAGMTTLNPQPFYIGADISQTTGLPVEVSKIEVRNILIYNQALSVANINVNRALDSARFR